LAAGNNEWHLFLHQPIAFVGGQLPENKHDRLAQRLGRGTSMPNHLGWRRGGTPLENQERPRLTKKFGPMGFVKLRQKHGQSALGTLVRDDADRMTGQLPTVGSQLVY
jgi:hypothetical protein